MSNFLTDHPAIYEARFPDPDQSAARFVASALTRHLGPGPRTILDLGCGTGRDAGALAARGHTVVGVDLAESMIAHARSRHPGCEFVVGDLRTVDLGRRFDAVTCLDSSFLYCHTNADIRAALRVTVAHLVPGGLFVAEMRNGAWYLGNPADLGREVLDEVEYDGVTHASATTLWIDHEHQLLQRRRTWTGPGITPDGGPLVQRSAWRLLLPQELRAFLEESGLTVLALFDSPGPNTPAGWPDHWPADLSTAMTGRRLHVVASRSTHQ